MPNFVDQKIPEIPSDVSIVGHAIVCANGMIADQSGNIPDALIVDADQQNFQAALDASTLIVLGRKGHERHPAKGRRRLVLTSSVVGFETDPEAGNIHFWNPQGADLASVLEQIGITQGRIAITGGQSVFGIFLPHYTSFILAQVHDAVVENGIACFANGHPEQVLVGAGMSPGAVRTLTQGVSETEWQPVSEQKGRAIS